MDNKKWTNNTVKNKSVYLCKEKIYKEKRLLNKYK